MTKKTMRTQFILLLMGVGLLAALPAIASAAGISGQWDFDGGDLTATVGSDMTYVALADPGDNVGFGSDTIGGQTANVVNFNFTEYYDRAGYFATPHGIGANGGGARVNDFTIIMDLKITGQAGNYVALWQTDSLNDLDNDADMYFWSSTGTNTEIGIGTIGYLLNGPDVGTWARLAFVADSAAGTMGVYLDGTTLGNLDLAAAGIDGRESLTPADDATAPWLNLFSNGVYPGYYSGAGSLNSLQIRDYAMSGEEVAALGGPTAWGLPGPHPIRPIAPANGAKLVPVEIDLSWTSPIQFTALGYDLYFGTEPNALSPNYDWEKKIDNQVVNSWDPPDGVDSGDLLNLTDYYWRVDVYEPNDAPEGIVIRHEGGIWHFKTEPESPVILSNPEDVLVLADGTAEFTVEHSNGTSYEWYKVGVVDPIDSGTTTSGETITLSLTSVSQADEGEYYCKVIGIGSELSASARLTIAKLISHWQFEENLNDSVDGNHGYSAGTGEVTYAAGKIGNFAISLSGVDPNEVVLVDHDEKLNSSAFTVALWAKVEGGSGTWRSPLTSRSEPPTAGYNLYASTSDTWQFWTGANGWQSIGGTAVVEGEWVFLVATYDARMLEKRLYVNGVAAGQVTLSAAINLNPAPNLLKIGGGGGGDPVPTVIFNGLIDDVKIWNYAINPFGVARLYTDVEGGTICAAPELLLYDFDGSCMIDLGDIAEFALRWLACNFAPDCLDEHTYKLD